MGSHQPIRKVVTPEIPDKLYFRIGDVAKLCDVPAYVLRFWESEFPALKPNKGGTGQRLYRRRDVEMALRVKSLLYDEGYTIPGARQVLKGEKAEPKAKAAAATGPQEVRSETVAAEHGAIDRRKLLALRGELHSLLETLSNAPAQAAREELKQEPKPPRGKLETMRPRGSSAGDKPVLMSTQQDLF